MSREKARETWERIRLGPLGFASGAQYMCAYDRSELSMEPWPNDPGKTLAPVRPRMFELRYWRHLDGSVQRVVVCENEIVEWCDIVHDPKQEGRSVNGSALISRDTQRYYVEVRPGIAAELTVTTQIAIWRVWRDRDMVAWGHHRQDHAPSRDGLTAGYQRYNGCEAYYEAYAAYWLFRTLTGMGVPVTDAIKRLFGQPVPPQPLEG